MSAPRKVAPTMAPRVGESSTPTADFVDRFKRATPWTDGILLEDAFVGSATVDVAHGLGRAYRGGWSVWTTGGHEAHVESPDDAAAAGVDVRQYVRVRSASGGTTHAFKLWVY